MRLVESSGRGFQNGRPVIRLEAHWFGKLTGYQFNESHPHISCRAWTPSLAARNQGEAWAQFEEAASLPFGASTSLHFLRTAGIRPRDKVLVIGASGGVGTAMVQLAKHFGAEVTGVTSTKNLTLVTSLGADRVIDYTKHDFTTRGETYDIVVDTVGGTSFARCRPVLRDKGRLLAVAAGMPEMLAALWSPLTGSRRVIAGPAAERIEDLPEMAALAETGALTPVIDRRYGFAQMAEAHAYVETGRKRGSVVVSVEPQL